MFPIKGGGFPSLNIYKERATCLHATHEGRTPSAVSAAAGYSPAGTALPGKVVLSPLMPQALVVSLWRLPAVVQGPFLCSPTALLSYLPVTNPNDSF